MDQYVSSAGQIGHLLLIDCRSLAYELVPMNQQGRDKVSLVIANSKVMHAISGGEYRTRVNQCEAALGLLKKVCSR